jgi:hypothetical protein
MTRQYRTMQTELSAKLRRVEEELALNQAQLGEAFCCIFATFRRFYFYDYALSITTTTFSYNFVIFDKKKIFRVPI